MNDNDTNEKDEQKEKLNKAMAGMFLAFLKDANDNNQLQKSASELYKLYSSLLVAGFDEDQSMQLLLAFIDGALNKI